jgi:hypothetical protein
MKTKTRKLIGSSVIDTVSYDIFSETLVVKFLSGTVWCYYEVPEEMYQGVISASSSGKYFNLHIRDKYASSKISKSKKTTNA